MRMLDACRGGALVGGEWMRTESPSQTGRVLHVFDKAIGEYPLPTASSSSVRTLRWSGRDETVAAIDAAHASPRNSPEFFRNAHLRAAALRRWHDLIVAELPTLAEIVTVESGKPIKESEAEIRSSASHVLWSAGLTGTGGLSGHQVQSQFSATSRRLVLKSPVGVVGCIVPWNFPALMGARKLAPAIGAGCTVVLKPSEKTPLSSIALVKLAIDAGIPADAINIVFGDQEEIGEAIMADDRVRKVSFLSLIHI